MSSHERLLSFIARIQRCRRTVAEMLDKSEGGIAPAPSRPGEARECEREVYAQPFCPFAESLSDDLGPMFGRDVVRLIDALEAVTTERDEALKSRDLWRENGYDLADHHDELRAERDALAAQVATLRDALTRSDDALDWSAASVDTLLCGHPHRSIPELHEYVRTTRAKTAEALSGLVEQPPEQEPVRCAACEGYDFPGVTHTIGCPEEPQDAPANDAGAGGEQ